MLMMTILSAKTNTNIMQSTKWIPFITKGFFSSHLYNETDVSAMTLRKITGSNPVF